MTQIQYLILHFSLQSQKLQKKVLAKNCIPQGILNHLRSSAMIVDVHSLLAEQVTDVDDALTQYSGDKAVTSATELTESPFVVTVNSSNVQLHCPVSWLQSHFSSVVLVVEFREENRPSMGHLVESGGAVVTPGSLTTCTCIIIHVYIIITCMYM